MSIENVREIMADPIIESECANEKHFVHNVLVWSLKLAEAAVAAGVDSGPENSREEMSPKNNGTLD